MLMDAKVLGQNFENDISAEIASPERPNWLKLMTNLAWAQQRPRQL
jgi:hypothetical protein